MRGTKKPGASLRMYGRVFFAGGLMGCAAHLLNEGYRWAGVPEEWTATAVLFTFGCLGAAGYVAGWYDRLEEWCGMGAILPLSGFTAAVARAVCTAREKGLPAAACLARGLKGPLCTLGSAYAVGAVLVLLCG